MPLLWLSVVFELELLFRLVLPLIFAVALEMLLVRNYHMQGIYMKNEV